jgi:pimeloyl-ACP methyl ester carboxylesterase
MIPAAIPIRVVWGDRDKVALKTRSRFNDQLPAHTSIETWNRCGHMIMWDRPAETIAAALITEHASSSATSRDRRLPMGDLES